MSPVVYRLAAFAALALSLGLALRPTPRPALESTQAVVEARYNWRLALVALVAGSLPLCFYWFGPDHRLGLDDVGAALVVLVLGAIGLADRRVKLRIDDVGVRSSAWGDTTVYWSELVSVRIVKIRAGLEQVQLIPVAGALARLQGQRDYLGLSALFLDHSVNQLHAAIAEHLYKNK